MNFQINYLMLSISLFATAFLILLTRQLALKIGLLDQPDIRKIHSKPVPLVGGVVLFVVASILLYVAEFSSVFATYLMIATSLMVIVGLLDDIYQLSALWRFFVQIVACILLVYFTGVKILTFGQLLYPGWDLQLGYFAIPVTVFGVVGVVNSLNMADGIDGLAAMTFFLPVFSLVIISDANGLTLWLMYLLMSVMIFAIFNQSVRFKVFLGDTGSLFLGFLLAWLLVLSSQANNYQPVVIFPVTALYLVGLPIFDTIFVMVRRIRKGHSPFNPDKTHLHHLFLTRGASQTMTLTLMLVLQLLMIITGLMFLYFRISEYIQFYLFVFLSIIYYQIMYKLWSFHGAGQ